MRAFCWRRGRGWKGYCGKHPGPRGKGRWTSGQPGVGPYNRSTGLLDRMEAVGRWAVDALQWRLTKRILRQYQWNWDRGWLQYRAWEEAAKLWARDGDQVLRMVCWHMRVLERSARRAVRAQVQQARTQIVGLEGPARVASREVGLPMREEWAGRAVIHDRAMLVLAMEAAAARRKRGLLPGPA